MPTLEFTGAFLRHFDVRRDEAGVFVRVHLTADFSREVMEVMGWQEVAAHVKSAKLDGRLAATGLVLSPDSALRAQEIKIAAHEVTDFEFFRVKNEKGQGHHTELRFIANSSQRGAGALLESYIHVVCHAAGLLTVNYVEQAKLPETPEPKPDSDQGNLHILEDPREQVRNAEG